jgi:hypothetical protein
MIEQWLASGDGPVRPDHRNIASTCLARAIFAVSGKCRHSIN